MSDLILYTSEALKTHKRGLMQKLFQSPEGGGGMSAMQMGRAYSPSEIIMGLDLGRCPRLVWHRAVGPEIPPNVVGPEIFRTNGAIHTSEGQRPGLFPSPEEVTAL